MRIVVQIGFRKTVKEGQLIAVTVNSQEIDRDCYPGKYLNDLAHRHTNSWYLAELDCKEGDIIVIDVKTGIRQRGQDENRTFRTTFRVDPTMEITTYEVPNVGMWGFPLLKGRVEEISTVSKVDERRNEAEALLDDEGF
jgi:hypothetical protein